MSISLESQLEAFLFWKGEPVSIAKIAAALNCTEPEAEHAAATLESSLAGRGLCLLRLDDEIELRTSKEAAPFIEALAKEEMSREIGKAGLETLSIILYRGPIKRSDIDYIRGVNSSFIIRNLMIRGLVERTPDKKGDARGFLYKPTMDLLAHLGVSRREELPEYEAVTSELAAFEQSVANPENENHEA